MSYLVSNYYKNPPPPYGALYGRHTTESFNTIPGWGIQPSAAGPEYVGIGASLVGSGPINAAALAEQAKLAAAAHQAELDGSAGFPWWGWIVGAGVLGAGLAVAAKRGWV